MKKINRRQFVAAGTMAAAGALAHKGFEQFTLAESTPKDRTLNGIKMPDSAVKLAQSIPIKSSIAVNSSTHNSMVEEITEARVARAKLILAAVENIRKHGHAQLAKAENAT